jgi:hypothetical protein
MWRTRSKIEPKIVSKKLNPCTKTYGYFKKFLKCGTITKGYVENHELNNIGLNMVLHQKRFMDGFIHLTNETLQVISCVRNNILI